MNSEYKKHDCDVNGESGGYGSAIDYCQERDNGQLWVGNGEYGTRVNYCPECGFKAPSQLEKESK